MKVECKRVRSICYFAGLNKLSTEEFCQEQQKIDVKGLREAGCVKLNELLPVS